MFFTDKKLSCKDCNQEFLFTAGEQDFYQQKGLQNEPGRCPDCRNRRKQMAIANNLPSVTGPNAQPVVMRDVSKVICANCGVETTVPFRPRLSRPVYCTPCKRQLEADELAAAKAAEVVS